MPPDPTILSLLSAGGPLGVFLVLLYFVKQNLNESLDRQHKIAEEYRIEVRALIEKYDDRMDRIISDHRSEMGNVIAQFRADLTTISADTTQAIEGLTTQIESLAGKIKE